MSESKLPFIAKSTAEKMALKWHGIKTLVVPQPIHIKVVAWHLSRKSRQATKSESNFICPKDKTGGICYTCSRKEG